MTAQKQALAGLTNRLGVIMHMTTTLPDDSEVEEFNFKMMTACRAGRWTEPGHGKAAAIDRLTEEADAFIAKKAREK